MVVMALLADNEIHLWLIDDAQVDTSLLEIYRSFLSPEEMLRCERFRFDKDKRQFLITRAAIRTTLSHYRNDTLPSQWQFDRNEYGRPYVVSPPSAVPLEFNLSHTNGMIAIAVCARGDIGVDVENTTRECRALDLAARYFSFSEVENLLALPESKQQERFLDLWTLKEAYIKACGMGLAIPLGSFSFDFAADAIAITFAEERVDDSSRWGFWQWAVSDYRIAVGLKSEQWRSMELVVRTLVPMGAISPIELGLLRSVR